METYLLNDDITLICLNAEFFPDGITDAFDRLNQIIGTNDHRTRYGISHGTENGKTIYKAAAEQIHVNEAAQLKLENFIIKKGEYIGARIINYPDHLESIAKTFEKLLSNPRLDPEGCCVEVYLNERDMQCMVRVLPKN